MTKDEALRLAIDVLALTVGPLRSDRALSVKVHAAIDACRAALSAPAAQPVPVVQPLTDAAAALLAARIVGSDAASVITAVRIIRETERAHGIGGANG